MNGRCLGYLGLHGIHVWALKEETKTPDFSHTALHSTEHFQDAGPAQRAARVQVMYIPAPPRGVNE